MVYSPPFTITPRIFLLAQNIARGLGLIAGRKIIETPFQLRREHRIKTITASLAIEGNTLTIDQVTAIMDGKRVLGPPKDILEVKNALLVYEDLKKFNPLSMEDFLGAHKILMTNLVDSNGKWRSENVGIFKGAKISHVAPSYKKVPSLMENLFQFLSSDESGLSWLLKACIFHYEMEFIHPFSDGNGRMGRFWRQLLLMKEGPVFEWIPIEVLIKEHKKDYYNVLGESDKQGDSTPFIEFSLDIISQSLLMFSKTASTVPKDHLSRLNYAKRHLSTEWFSRADYLVVHKDISSSTASRDLFFGLQEKILRCTGKKNQTRYRFSLQN